MSYLKNLLKIVILVSLTMAYTACKEKETELPESNPVVIDKIRNVEIPVSGTAAMPRLYSTGERLLLSWISETDSLSKLFYSTMDNGNWQEPKMVGSGTNWFVNWADFPAISENSGNILTNVLQKSDTATYSYDVKLYGYSAEKNLWFSNKILHDDGTKSEHGFVSIEPFDQNKFFVSWLDGRNTAGGSHGHSGGAMTVRAAIVDANGKVIDSYELDDRVCDCCPTSMTLVNGKPIVAYRDRSEDEIRDISVVRYEGGKWSQPLTLGNDNWRIEGCPVNGPSTDSYNQTVGVAWFTAAKGEGEVMVSFSEDGGNTFGESFRMDSGNATGRVDLVMLSENAAAIIWMEPENDEDVIRLMQVDKTGNFQPPIVISKITAERSSGFPQLERLGEQLYIAWTEVNGDQKTIRMATVAIDHL